MSSISNIFDLIIGNFGGYNLLAYNYSPIKAQGFLFDFLTYSVIVILFIQLVISFFLINKSFFKNFIIKYYFLSFLICFILVALKLYFLLNIPLIDVTFQKDALLASKYAQATLWDALSNRVDSTFTYFGNYWILGTALLLLCLFSSLISLFILGDKSLFKNQHNTFFFSLFLICTCIMTSTTNLLAIYLSFEFIFLPTLYFIFKLGYVQKTDKAIQYLLFWTLFGSFFILSLLLYIYVQYYTLDLQTLKTISFTELELFYFTIIVFFGFGAKIPIFPFHFWLTKVHVEAPAGFSIFLSGFLVKTAFFCFSLFFDLFINSWGRYVIGVLILFGAVEASLKFWTQTDLKRLIALATIQEMNLLFFLWLFYYNSYFFLLALFLVMHGILSSILFFFVDIIQKYAQDRDILELSGILHSSPILKVLTWIIGLFFLAVPFSIKFVIEINIINIFIMNHSYLGIALLFIIVVIGGLGFMRQLLILLYGAPTEKYKDFATINLLKGELFLFVFLLLLLFSLIFFI